MLHAQEACCITGDGCTSPRYSCLIAACHMRAPPLCPPECLSSALMSAGSCSPCKTGLAGLLLRYTVRRAHGGVTGGDTAVGEKH
jgi:hypothetical protein